MRHALKKYEGVQDSNGVIPEDEPVFLLRGTDPLVPEVIRYWTYLATLAGVNEKRLDIALSQIKEIEKYQLSGKANLPGADDETC